MGENNEVDKNIIRPSENIFELLETCPKNKTIVDNMVKAWSRINSPKYKKIICSISGGSDSDVMLDICFRCDKDKKIDYVWFDTGLEYQATKDHIKFLEEKYGIEIMKYKAIKPIPTSCKQYGQPFISKQVSEFIQRLQRHGFTWEDRPFDELYKEFPKCKSALEWWCGTKGEGSAFNISRNKYLKEFMMENPPTFKISNKCCKYAKKDVAHKCISENKYDLSIYGVRKSEGGVRATAYKSCFDDSPDKYDNYRPLFWYTDSDKKEYEIHFDVIHSICYSEYGLKRTGCIGCPFNRNIDFELGIMKQYEPKLYKAACNIFRDSYEYTRRYREYVAERKNLDGK